MRRAPGEYSCTSAHPAPAVGGTTTRFHQNEGAMTIAKLQLIRRLLLQLVAMVDEELRTRRANYQR